MCLFIRENVCMCFLESICMCVCVWHPRVAVMINGGVDPFHKWEEEGGRKRLPHCMTHCVSHIQTDSAGLADGPPLISHIDPSRGGKGHWSEARWWSHVFILGCYEEDIYQWMITVFFPVLCWPCWGENLHHNIFKGTSHHMKQYCMWQLTCNLWKWRGCVHPLWLILIFFVCDRPRTWWEERRHFLGTEQPQRSIFPTCCCSIFNAVHPCCSRREWQWKAWVTFTFVVILLRFVLGKENSHWWRSASLWGKLKFLSVPLNNGRNHFTV